ncbi:MAG TPA: hypothetical protein PLT65_05530 [Bacilli bacterium]|nr:hypothetical protein [Bacilli bacterium]
MELTEEQKKMRKLYREYKIAQRKLEEHNSSVWEKDFAEKNRKAMKGVSESEEEFAKRNKKAWKNSNIDIKKVLGWFIFFIVLLYFYYFINDMLSNNSIKYFAGLCLVGGLIFGAYLVGGFNK